MKPVDYNTLQLFIVVARHLNFRRAAMEMGMPATSLSQRIREFEANLGVRLLNRTTRSVAVTEAGKRVLDEVAGSLAHIDQAIASVGGVGPSVRGTIRINGPRPAIDFRLAHLVTAFLAAHHDMKIEVVSDEALVSVVASGFDAGIRYGESVEKDMIAVSLGGPQRLVVVGSRSYFEQHGRPGTPADLRSHRCLAQVFPRGNRLQWEFEKESEVISFVPQGPLASSEPGVQLLGAKQGLGLAYLFEEHCIADVERGDLEIVLDEWCQPFPGPFLYYPERRLMPAGLRAFVDFIKDFQRAARSE